MLLTRYGMCSALLCCACLTGYYTASFTCTAAPSLPTLFKLNAVLKVNTTGGCSKLVNANSTLDGDDVPTVNAAAVPAGRVCANKPVTIKYNITSSVGYNSSTKNWLFAGQIQPADAAANVACSDTVTVTFLSGSE
jgi:hypothetical protein